MSTKMVSGSTDSGGRDVSGGVPPSAQTRAVEKPCSACLATGNKKVIALCPGAPLHAETRVVCLMCAVGHHHLCDGMTYRHHVGGNISEYPCPCTHNDGPRPTRCEQVGHDWKPKMDGRQCLRCGARYDGSEDCSSACEPPLTPQGKLKDAVEKMEALEAAVEAAKAARNDGDDEDGQTITETYARHRDEVWKGVEGRLDNDGSEED